jgi:hypothetical protein
VNDELVSVWKAAVVFYLTISAVRENLELPTEEDHKVVSTASL